MLNPDEFKDAVQNIVALGANAVVLVQAVKLAKDPETDLATFCALLKNDGPLSADIIRISNSSYYGPATLHGNLQSAIAAIRMQQVIRVINISLSRHLFTRNLATYGITASEYWCESIGTALVMESLARHAGQNAEDAYTIGILHGIGRLLINRIIEDQGYAIFWNGREPIEDWERHAVGFDFAETGAFLLDLWTFPTATCEVIRWQLDPAKAGEPDSLLSSLQFASRLLALTGSDFENKDWKVPEADPYLLALDLAPAQVCDLVAACRHDFQRIHQSLAAN